MDASETPDNSRPPASDPAALPVPERRASLAARVVLVFFAALLAYGATALAMGRGGSPQGAYFNHLAESFLHGRLHLPTPPGQHDLTPYEGRWYVPFPPLPAVLMLPSVAWLGLDRLSTVWFSVVVGALNVALVAWTLGLAARRGWIGLRPGGQLWLVALFALGTAHWQLAPDGAVWFVSQVCTFTFAALAVVCAMASPSPWPAGIALAAALWGRPNILLLWPLLAGLALLHDGGRAWASGVRTLDWGRIRGWMLRSGVPVGLSILGLMTYNYARFDNPLDFGYKRQNVDTSLLGDLHGKGQFSTEHVLRNLRVMLFAAPRWPAGGLPVPDDRGMSLLLTMPALLYLVRLRRSDLLVRSAALSLALLLIPLVTYYNTGWRQFGYRFSLDFMLPLLLLLAAAAGSRVSWPLRGLIVLGILVNAWGVAWWYGALMH